MCADARVGGGWARGRWVARRGNRCARRALPMHLSLVATNRRYKVGKYIIEKVKMRKEW